MVFFGNEDEAVELSDTGGECAGGAVVAAGGQGDTGVTPAESVHTLRESDAIFLSSGGITPFKFQEELVDAGFPFGISGSDEWGVADFLIGDKFEGFQFFGCGERLMEHRPVLLSQVEVGLEGIIGSVEGGITGRHSKRYKRESVFGDSFFQEEDDLV